MVNVKVYDVTIAGAGGAPMVVTPNGNRGSFFNDQQRDTDSVQTSTAATMDRSGAWGEHLFKLGADIMWSAYRGQSTSRAIEIRRTDGTLSRQIDFASTATQDVTGLDTSAFVQDRWRVLPALTIELGLRADRDAVPRAVGWSPRAGIAVTPHGSGRTVLRGGVGVFYQRTPLNIAAFESVRNPVNRIVWSRRPDAARRAGDIGAHHGTARHREKRRLERRSRPTVRAVPGVPHESPAAIGVG